MRFQLVIDCADPTELAAFWCEALGYAVEPPPDGFENWRLYWMSKGVPGEEAGEADWADSIIDPEGHGPRIWFQQVPEAKTVKNRVHLDVSASGGRNVPMDLRRQRVDAEVDRLIGLGARIAYKHDTPGIEHYAVTMYDPEGNEFCVN